MRRSFFLFLILFATLGTLSASLFSADLPSVWRSWRYSRSIGSATAGGLSFITLDRAVFTHSENRLADLRTIDDQGQEISYEVRSQITPPPQPVRVSATLRENSFVPQKFTQVVLDLGEHAVFHNSLRILTPESDFINWVEIAASDDAHVWRIVNPRAPISRFHQENLEGNQTVRYSENNARYLRVRVQESEHRFEVTDIEVFSSPKAEKEGSEEDGIPLAVSLVPNPDGIAARTTRWTVDLGSSNIPVKKFSFETSQPEFYRAVRFLTSTNGREWEPTGGGEIHRYKVDGQSRESLAVQCFESWGPRYWRVEVLNADDAPLSAVRLSVFMPLRFVLFRASSGRSYRLLYGNYRAKIPQYDLERTLQVPSIETMSNRELGPEEPTINYADPRPFSERHPDLLWMALGVAVLLLGYSALRALRTAPSPEKGSL